MYKVNKKVLDAFEQPTREFEVRVTINDTDILTGEHIQNYKITESILPDNNLALGTTCSSKLELNMFLPDNLQKGLTGAKIDTEIGIKTAEGTLWEHLGIFYVDDIETSDNYRSVKITAFDSIQKISELGNVYDCKAIPLEGGVLASSVIKDICEQAGVKCFVPDAQQEYSHAKTSDTESVLYVEKSGTYPDGRFYDEQSVGCKLLEIAPTKYDSMPLYIHINEVPKDGTLPIPPSLFINYYTESGEFYAHYTVPHQNVTVFTREDGTIDLECNIGTQKADIPLFVGVSFHTYDWTSQGENLPCDFHIAYHDAHTMAAEFNSTAVIPISGTVNVSPREMLGYMAGYLGVSAKMNRDDVLTTKMLKLGTDYQTQKYKDYTISREHQTQNGLIVMSENPIDITYVTSGISNTSTNQNQIITSGTNGFGFNYSNPYITYDTLTLNILNLYKGQQLVPLSVTTFGNPYLECGDSIFVEDELGNKVPFIILSLETSVGGGFKQTIKCEPDLKNKQELISNPVTQTISRKNTEMEELYQNFVNALTGVDGGYIKFVLDDFKKVRAFAIPFRDIELKWDSTNNKVIVANDKDKNEPMWVFAGGGWSFTPDGGKTYRVGANYKGEVFANVIEAISGKIGRWSIDDEGLIFTDTDKSTIKIKPLNTPDRTPIEIKNAAGESIFSIKDDGTIFSKVILADGLWATELIATSLTTTNQIKTRGLKGQESEDGRKLLIFGEGAEKEESYFDTYVQFQKETSFSGDMSLVGYKSFNFNNSALRMYGDAGQIYLNFHAASGTVPLVVDTQGRITVNGSSERFKENIKPVNKELDPTALYDLEVKQYNYKDEFNNKSQTGGTEIGIIAEELDKVYPNAVIYDDEGKPTGWHDGILIPAMLKLIQDQHKDIEDLKARLDKLEKEGKK